MDYEKGRYYHAGFPNHTVPRLRAALRCGNLSRCQALKGIAMLREFETPPYPLIMKHFKFFAVALIVVCAAAVFPQARDAELARVQSLDAAEKDSSGALPVMGVADHMYRADVYMSNRQFPAAQAHWKIVLEKYPDDPAISKALFGMGRSNMWQRNYETAIEWFGKAVRDHIDDEWGQESLNYKGACYVRIGANLEAAETYGMYAAMFPNGKRIESAYLNIIDAYREAGEYKKADEWVDKTVAKFRGQKTEINALHARLRMNLYTKDWKAALGTAETLLNLNRFRGSMAELYEIVYLKGFALENDGAKELAARVYSSIPADPSNYYAGLASDRLEALGESTAARKAEMRSRAARLAGQFPVRYKSELIRYANERNIDPRFMLAIMKQESSFRANAKSPAAARGLLQLTYDTALVYKDEAGFAKITANSLYSPVVNIAIGAAYIQKLKDQFSGLYEPIAASYNGGEDNAERWLNRSEPKDRAIFASEVGFAETKNYVFKVMSNYRVYQELCDEKLDRIQ